MTDDCDRDWYEDRVSGWIDGWCAGKGTTTKV